MSSNSSQQSVISWQEIIYQDLEAEKAVNRELEHFVLDVLNRNRFVRYCSLCSQSKDLHCTSDSKVHCARGIFQKAEIVREKTPLWFADIILDRVKKSIKKCDRSKSVTFLERKVS